MPTSLYGTVHISADEAVAVQPSMIFMVNKYSLIVYPLASFKAHINLIILYLQL